MNEIDNQLIKLIKKTHKIIWVKGLPQKEIEKKVSKVKNKYHKINRILVKDAFNKFVELEENKIPVEEFVLLINYSTKEILIEILQQFV